MFALETLFAASVLASTALAHFTLDYPTSRGFDDDNEPQFCGGFNSVETRQSFPLGQGPVHIDSHHNLATVVAFISTSPNPTSFDDFNTTSNGTSIPLATDFFQVTSGEKCFNVNLGALEGLGLTNGSEVTLQIQYDGGDGNLYQCADLILIDGYTVPSNETCTSDAATGGNATSSATTGGSSTVASSAATSPAATTGSGTASGSGGSSGALAQREIIGWGVLGAVMGLATLAVL
ncbi:hypothetical protein IAT40_005618 [Kwoniella sp. CBS 6097]